jgi:hypothetical protein
MNCKGDARSDLYMPRNRPRDWCLGRRERQMSAPPKSKGFSQIPHGFHKRLAELTGNQLKVWLAHRCMEGKEGESYPSLGRLVEYTGLNLHTVTDARKWLRTNGWLTSGGQKHTAQGKFSVPIEHTAIPEAGNGKTTSGQTTCSKTTDDAGRKTASGAGGKTACGKTAIEVDPKDFEVDPKEVHPSYLPTAPGLAGGTAGGNPSETKSTAGAAGREERTLTEELMLEDLQKTHLKTRNKHNDQKGHEGRYDDVPATPNLIGCRELLYELYKRSITRVEQMNLVCAAYESWFECKYLASFDAKSEAENRACDQAWNEAHGKSVSCKAIYVPEPIRCPLVVFRKEIGIYLDEAREQQDDSE